MSFTNCNQFITNLIKCIETNSSDTVFVTDLQNFDLVRCVDYNNFQNKLKFDGISINCSNNNFSNFSNDELTIHYDNYTKSLNIYPSSVFRLSSK